MLHDGGPTGTGRRVAVASASRRRRDRRRRRHGSTRAVLGAYRDVADRVLRYEFRPPVDRPRHGCSRSARRDWILSIDGDEVPSADDGRRSCPHLVDATDVSSTPSPPVALPTLRHVARRAAVVARLPDPAGAQRTPLSPCAAGFTAGSSPCSLSATSTCRSTTSTASSSPRRNAGPRPSSTKRSSPALGAIGGGLLNETLYLPERRGAHGTAPGAAGRRCSAGAPSSPPRRPAHPPPEPNRAMRAQCRPCRRDRRPVPSNGLPDSAYRVGLALFDRDGAWRRVRAGPSTSASTNVGSAWWPWGLEQEPHMRVSYHWRTLDGRRRRLRGRSARRSPPVSAPGDPDRPGRGSSAPDRRVATCSSSTSCTSTSAGSSRRSRVADGRRGPTDADHDDRRPQLPRAGPGAGPFVPRAPAATDGSWRSWSTPRPRHRVGRAVRGRDPGRRSPSSPAELRRMAAIYDVTELATALKPLVPRSPAVGAASRRSPISTPTSRCSPRSPISTSSLAGTRSCSRRTGSTPTRRRARARRAGAVSVRRLQPRLHRRRSAARDRSSTWWSDHCRRDCVVDPGEGLFVDQRWIDLAVTYFDHHVVRDRGCNVAYWNLDERPLVDDGGDGYAPAVRRCASSTTAGSIPLGHTS